MWRKLLQCRDKAKSLYKVDVRSGHQTSFWFDNWSSMGSLFDVTGARGCIDMGIPIHATVAEAMWRSRRQNHRSERFRQIENLLQNLRNRGPSNEGDINLWKSSGDTYRPVFNSKNTWKLIRETNPEVPWHGGVWFQHLTPKFSFCTWLAAQNRLSTGDRMLSWSGAVNASCVFCQDPLETRNHLFFACRFSAEVWQPLSKGILQRSYSTHWPNIISFISDSAQPRLLLFLARYAFQATIHSIWRERNCRRHGDPPISSGNLVKLIDKQIRNRISSIRQMGDTKYEDALQLWFGSRS